mmetsp:Transcript_4704/g.4125  ORF Transcript_4704/g.4125 Transcript_4704/m.4125 type:complete len:398 (-) Transcript_4704:658-1851(-)
MFQGIVNLGKRAIETVGLAYNLDQLMKAIEESHRTDDPKHILIFIKHIDSFWENDKIIAFNCIQNAFWSKSYEKKYLFTSLFHKLTANDLVTLLQKMNDEILIKFIFQENNTILSHYKLCDLLLLLNIYHSQYENFAWYIYDKYYRLKGFGEYDTSQRYPFLKCITFEASMVMLGDHENGIKCLNADELMVLFKKCKQYISSHRKHNIYHQMTLSGFIRESTKGTDLIVAKCIYDLCETYLNHQQTVECIMVNALDANIKKMSVNDLCFMINGELIPILENQRILTELDRRKAIMVQELSTKYQLLSRRANECKGVMYSPQRSFGADDNQYVKELQSHISGMTTRYAVLAGEMHSYTAIVENLNELNDAIIKMSNICNERHTKYQFDKYRQEMRNKI